MCVGFKEWALVCEALGAGRQSVILRKGGIAEGRAGFRFEHPEFLLLPTLFHEQVSKLKLPPETRLPQQTSGRHEIRFRVQVEWTRELTDWEQIQRLDRFHLWTEQTVRDRFLYDGKEAVSLAFVRVFQLSEPLVFPDEPRYGGCRSWVELPEVPEGTVFEPVLDEKTHRQRESELLAELDR